MTFGLENWASKHAISGNSVRLPNENNVKRKPFLQWVGGKREMIENYPNLVPQEFNNYHEPFLGGGAMMFHVKADKAFLNDSNPDLITTYKAISKNVDSVIKILTELKKHHSKDFYLEVRQLDRDAKKIAKFNEFEIAARLIYLNQTGFNGVYRVNRKGEYNVPIGSSLNKLICDAPTLKTASDFMKNYVFTCKDFSDSIKNIQEKDFLYLDPPYVPISEYSDFTRYTKEQFTLADQQRVYELFKSAADKGAYVLLSNSDTQVIRELYKEYNIYTIQSSRNISSKGTGRGKVNEVAVSNYKVEI